MSLSQSRLRHTSVYVCVFEVTNKTDVNQNFIPRYVDSHLFSLGLSLRVPYFLR